MLGDQFTCAVSLEDVFGDRKVPFLFGLVCHDEDKVEPGEQGGGHVDLIGDVPEHIEPAILRICCTEECTP